MALEVEKLFSKKIEKMKKTTICHCRTTMISNELKFEWTLENFSRPSKSFTTFKTTGIAHCYQAFTVNVSFNKAKDMIYFHTWFMAEKKNLRASYNIYIEFKGKRLYPCEVNGIYLTHNMLVYEISLNRIQEDVSFDLICDGLRVYFLFYIVESVSNDFFQTIIDQSEESAIDKFGLDKRSGIKVHFLVEETFFSIDKGLLYSKSNEFEDIFEDMQKRKNLNQLRIYAACNDFKHFISYLETGSLDKLSEKCIDDVEKHMKNRSFYCMQNEEIYRILHYLITQAKKYNVKGLALLCEKFLIKAMHRLNVREEMMRVHEDKAKTAEQYAIQFFKLHYNDFCYFSQHYFTLHKKLILQNFNYHKMFFKTEEYDPDTFNVKS